MLLKGPDDMKFLIESCGIANARHLAAAVLAALSVAGATGAQEPSLPAPSGEHTVGTSLFTWTDERREELWTSDPEDRRRLVIQLWFPASPTANATRAPYVPELGLLQSSFDRFWPALFSHVSSFNRPSISTGEPLMRYSQATSAVRAQSVTSTKVVSSTHCPSEFLRRSFTASPMSQTGVPLGM